MRVVENADVVEDQWELPASAADAGLFNCRGYERCSWVNTIIQSMQKAG